MTKMLDVLESFLNYHGYIYLRLDGTTRVEQRQVTCAVNLPFFMACFKTSIKIQLYSKAQYWLLVGFHMEEEKCFFV